MTTTRRTALSLAAVAGTTTTAACGGDSGSGAGDGTGGSEGAVTVATADVPEGGGLVRDRLVVTQPSAGEFKAFDGTCSHQGCAVSEVTSDAIVCPCHGSEFSIADGSVLKGPATSGLTARTATVDGDRITVS